MRKTSAASFDMDVLEKRITVSDQELAFMLGVGLVTARKIAEDANAVVRVYGRKQNVVSKVRRYIENLSENQAEMNKTSE